MKVKRLLKTLVCMMLVLLITFSSACTLTPPDDEKVDLGKDYPHISIVQAIAIAESAGETPTSAQFTVVGTVKTVKNPTYGEMIVEDETGELYVYGCMAEDGTYYDAMANKPIKGDQIVLKGVLQTYGGEAQMGSNGSKAIIVAFHHEKVEIDPSEYTSATVKVARDAEEGAKMQVEGVVAQITYANGKIPCGFILADDTATVYVYDGDAAAQVAVGNKVKIAATKTYWVLGSEEDNAALYGYKGACQLSEVSVISNDKGNGEWSKTSVTKTTVKDILDTPVTENITTQVYEVTAKIEKREGTGFTNYYIVDLDNATSSYVYTQCNGSDFAWLDEFDGSICKVYVTALNAKSAPAGCFFRFLPISVEKVEGFTFAEADVPEFVLKYAVSDLFTGKAYGSNPTLALPKSYANELIGVDGATITYASSDTSVATIDMSGENAVINLLKKGTATITVTATYKSYTATMTKTVELDPSAEITTPTISEIIAMADETKVQVRGVVMSSLVNRDGFYLGDNTGMIAVLTNSEVLSQVKPGDEVVMEGYKVHFKKAATEKCIGQIAIVGSIGEGGGSENYTSDSKLVVNYYGDKAYSTAYFTEGKTIDELYAFDAMEDYTTNVYKVNAKIVASGSAYYSNLLIQDENGTNQLRLYCSGAAQYAFLQPYVDQVVELELALCNWNDKNYYTGCVISVTANGVKTLNTLNFTK